MHPHPQPPLLVALAVLAVLASWLWLPARARETAVDPPRSTRSASAARPTGVGFHAW